jgi:hypothetical protein
MRGMFHAVPESIGMVHVLILYTKKIIQLESLESRVLAPRYALTLSLC